MFEADGWTVIRLRDPEDRGRVTALSAACPHYAALVTGMAPAASDGDEFFEAHPPGHMREGMLKLGVRTDDDGLSAVLDVVMDYPAPGVWYVGLLLIHPRFRRRGMGRSLVTALGVYARAKGAESLRLGVVAGNAPALAFWSRLGFAVVGETRDQRIGGRDHVVIEWARGLNGA